MYSQRQHLDLFHGPGLYLFRGTLPSTSFGNAYQGCGVTPTSVDPIVATLFACRYNTEGPAIVLIAQKSEFTRFLDGPNLSSFLYEQAVNIELLPYEFESKCIRKVSLGDSLDVLQRLGYELPTRLLDLGSLTQALVNSPRMLVEEIDRYVALLEQSASEG